MSAAALRVAVVGAAGRLGTFACELLAREPGFELVARIGRDAALVPALRASAAQLALDATVAGLGAEHGRILLECGIRPVIGTSGVTRAEAQTLDALARARGLGGLVVPNFSLAMAWMQRAGEELVRFFPEVEIFELHHPEKKDAPSSTARDSAERLARLRGGRSVPIHSVRLPGHYAHQVLLFGGGDESLTLRHDMHGPRAFGPGILAALRHAARAQGVAFGLEAALAGEGWRSGAADAPRPASL